MYGTVHRLTRFSADKGRLVLTRPRRLAEIRGWKGLMPNLPQHTLRHPSWQSQDMRLIARACVRKRRAPGSFIVIPFCGPATLGPVASDSLTHPPVPAKSAWFRRPDRLHRRLPSGGEAPTPPMVVSHMCLQPVRFAGLPSGIARSADKGR